MIYNSCTFLDYYSLFCQPQAYLLPTHGNAAEGKWGSHGFRKTTLHHSVDNFFNTGR